MAILTSRLLVTQSPLAAAILVLIDANQAALARYNSGYHANALWWFAQPVKPTARSYPPVAMLRPGHFRCKMFQEQTFYS
jgi:hypothetical protein